MPDHVDELINQLDNIHIDDQTTKMQDIFNLLKVTCQGGGIVEVDVKKALEGMSPDDVTILSHIAIGAGEVQMWSMLVEEYGATF
jgi:hypothetical protein